MSTGYEQYGDKQLTDRLEICKMDILENLPQSQGGLYIGSEGNDGSVVLIAYGMTEFMRKGIQALLSKPILKEILLQELEANK